MILLFASDTFTSFPVANVSVPQGGGDNFHSGADLSKLNEIKAAEEKVSANPNDVNALLHLGHLYNDSGFYDKAVSTYQKYLKTNPNNADVLVDMGVCYFEMNQNNKAIETMESALRVNPKHQIAHFNLGIVNFSSGNLEVAKEWWRKTIQLNPDADIAKRAEQLLQSH